jgi:hypothetical protein
MWRDDNMQREETMTKLLRTMVAAAAFAVAGLATNQVAAAPLADPAGLRAALGAIEITDKAQYTYDGKSYCWYDDGWNGPGWYVCGQYTVRGVGWGGGAGWHGWAHTGGGTAVRGGSVTRGRTVSGAGRVGGGTGGSRVGGGRTGGSHVSGGRTGGSHASGGRTGGSRTGGGRTGGRTGGHGGGGRRR